MSTFMTRLGGWLRSISDLTPELDRNGAAARIRGNVWFRGANVWILAFSIVIASVGLNVNSTAVIIGAMLVSPLMGPIIGIGFSMGTYDGHLLKDALRNLLIMFLVSLVASTAYFLLSPLSLADPTELEARTSPTFFDVLIALFGGLAGMLESSRTERGTVISGVAIATALMPPLCTAGYGLATGQAHFLFGALFLFIINTVFIILATYLMTKFLRFEPASFVDARSHKRTRRVVTLLMLVILIPSTISAIQMVRVNRFELRVRAFIEDNQMFGNRYLYKYNVEGGWSPSVDVYITGDLMQDYEKDVLYTAAHSYGIENEQMRVHEQQFGAGKQVDYQELMKDLFTRYEEDIAQRDARITDLESKLQAFEQAEFDYRQIGREVRHQFPQVQEFVLTRGARVQPASEELDMGIFVTAVVSDDFPEEDGRVLLEWLRLRLNTTNLSLYLTHTPLLEIPVEEPQPEEIPVGDEEEGILPETEVENIL